MAYISETYLLPFPSSGNIFAWSMLSYFYFQIRSSRLPSVRINLETEPVFSAWNGFLNVSQCRMCFSQPNIGIKCESWNEPDIRNVTLFPLYPLQSSLHYSFLWRERTPLYNIDTKLTSLTYCNLILKLLNFLKCYNDLSCILHTTVLFNCFIYCAAMWMKSSKRNWK
jgi:hypothetical protein